MDLTKFPEFDDIHPQSYETHTELFIDSCNFIYIYIYTYESDKIQQNINSW